MKKLFKPGNVFLLFVGIVCLFQLDKIIMGDLCRIRFWDEFNYSFVIHYDYGRLLSKYGLFFWNPSMAGGMPAFANQFSPVAWMNLFTQMISLPKLYTNVVISTIALGGFGMFLFMKRVLSLPDKLALFGGLVFSFTLAETRLIHDEFLFAYLFPLFLMCTSYLDTSKYKWRIIGYLTAVFIMTFSEPVMTFPYYAYSQLLVVLFWTKEDKKVIRRKAVGSILMWFAYAVYFFPIIYDLFYFAPVCNRVYVPVNGIQLTGILRTLNTLLYHTHIVFLIPGVFILAFINKDLRRYLAPVLIATGIILFFRLPTSNILHGTFLEKLDLRQSFSTFFFFYVAFSFVVFNKAVNSKRDFKILSITTLVTLFAVFMFWKFLPHLHRFPSAKKELFANIFGSFSVYAILSLMAHAKLKFSTLTRVKLLRKGILAAAVVSALLAVIMIKVLTFKEDNISFRKFGDLEFIRKNIPEDHVGRIAALGLPPAAVRYAGYESLGSQCVFFYQYFEDYFYRIINGQMELLSEAEKKFAKEYHYSLGLMQPYQIFILNGMPAFWGGIPGDLGIDFDLLREINVTHIVTTEKHPQLAAVSKRVITDGRVLPKMMPKDLSSIGGIIKTIKNRIEVNTAYFPLVIYELDNVKDRVFYNEIQPGGGVITKTVKMVKYSPDEIVVEFNAENPGVLEISNNYNPHWKAFVNGKEEDVFRSRTAFQGIKINSPGRKKVIIAYINTPLKWLALTCPPVALLLWGLFYRKKTKFFTAERQAG